jgi:outer membrane protein assembly factor BamA
MGRAAVLLGAMLGGAAPLAGQEPWAASYFPYFLGGPTDGLMLVLRYQVVKNAPYFLSRTDEQDVLNPLSFAGAFSAEAGAGTRGSRFVSLQFRGPGLLAGWRVHGTLEGRRDGRFAAYELGPRDEDASQPPPTGPADFNRVRRDRYLVRGELTRNVAGPLRVAVAASVERTEFHPIGTPSFLAESIEGTDATLRGTVVVDTRNSEFVPANGLLAEAGLFAGSNGSDPDLPGGDARKAYTGGYLHLRGYLSPREGTVLAARFGLRALSSGAPYSARFNMPGWERDLTVLGGPDSHRGLIKGRFGGRGILLGGLEVRHDLLNAGDFGALTLVAFVDGGRVFEPGGVTLTTRAWEMGYGGGVSLRILRSAILTLSFAGGDDGFTFGTGIGWAF